MNLRDREVFDRVTAGFDQFAEERWPLPGIAAADNRETLIQQILESVHRVQYVRTIAGRDVAECRSDPEDLRFDPLKAAIAAHRRGDDDEAYWLIFLLTHFGKHRRAGWKYVREIFGRLGEEGRWDWASTSQNPAAFRAWLHAHQDALTTPGVPHGFGNHRKYESLNAHSRRGTGAVVESYVEWIEPPRTQAQLFGGAIEAEGGNPTAAFARLYRSMDVVISFGRTARFDFLTMIGKVGLAAIEADSTYLVESTGPKNGARLLLQGGDALTALELQQRTDVLDNYIAIGKQPLEDALCNWQKSPNEFIPFRG